MDIKEIKTKTVHELQLLLNESRIKLDELNFKAVQNQLKNVREIRVIKKTIARIMSALKQAVK
ncbi:MAG: 50S ribosomal protein L29 [bacterium]